MKAQPLTVYLPDTRGVEISRYGMGNLKLGFGVHTYSRLPGRPTSPFSTERMPQGTCPGATVECEAICYAKSVSGPVWEVWTRNGQTDEVPPIPEECKLLRIHVSGDFDSVSYIRNWQDRLEQRPDVTAWAYTRSWRVLSLLPQLEALRALPNMQLFASMDYSTEELPPAGWRRAWIYTADQDSTGKIDRRIGWPLLTSTGQRVYVNVRGEERVGRIFPDRTPHYACPEETGHKRDCMTCGYCFEGQKHDVTFIEHNLNGGFGAKE